MDHVYWYLQQGRYLRRDICRRENLSSVFLGEPHTFLPHSVDLLAASVQLLAMPQCHTDFSFEADLGPVRDGLVYVFASALPEPRGIQEAALALAAHLYSRVAVGPVAFGHPENRVLGR